MIRSENNSPVDYISSVSFNELLINTIAKIDCCALGIAIGSLLGIELFLITNFLVLRGNITINTYFSLLNEYFWGYEITTVGSFIGLFYGFFAGFLLGWFVAFTRNFIVRIFLYVTKYKNRMISVNNFIDYP